MTDTLNIETGCYIGSSWGIYSIDELHDLVAGFMPDKIRSPYDEATFDDDGLIIDLSHTGLLSASVTLSTGEVVYGRDAGEFVSEMYDTLTELLPTDPDHSWIWRDGELFYWSDDDIDKMGDF